MHWYMGPPSYVVYTKSVMLTRFIDVIILLHLLQI